MLTRDQSKAAIVLDKVKERLADQAKPRLDKSSTLFDAGRLQHAHDTLEYINHIERHRL